MVTETPIAKVRFNAKIGLQSRDD